MKILHASVLALALGLAASPALAQTSTTNPSTTNPSTTMTNPTNPATGTALTPAQRAETTGQVTTTRTDDHTDMGWVGLLGLVGLAGLLGRKRRDPVVHNTAPGVNNTTNRI